MKIVIIPTGIDLKEGRQLAPILEDGRFIFIPFPEFAKDDDRYKQVERLIFITKNIDYKLSPYSDIPIESWPEYPNKKTMGDFLEDRVYNGYPIRSYIPHFDPNFRSPFPTYGEGSHNKARILSELEEDDILVFYASFSRPGEKRFLGKFLIGYITIDEVLDFRFKERMIVVSANKADESNNEWDKNLLEYKVGLRDVIYKMTGDERLEEFDNRIKDNFHIIRGDGFPSKDDIYGSAQPVIAIGKPKKSMLFNRAIKFTDNEMEILPEILDEIIWPFITNKLIRGVRILEGHEAEIFWDYVQKRIKESEEEH